MAETTLAEDIAALIWDHQNELAEGGALIMDVLDRLADSAPDVTIGDFRLGLSLFLDKRREAYALADALVQ